jgi:hypothetical protein
MGDKLIKISTALKALPLLPGQESLSVASSGTHKHRVNEVALANSLDIYVFFSLTRSFACPLFSLFFLKSMTSTVYDF